MATMLFRKSLYMFTTICLIILSTGSASHATTTMDSNLGDWEARVLNIDLLTTIAANIESANEVSSTPGDHTDVGGALTFLNSNTGLSRDFRVKTEESGATFIFNEEYSGTVYPSYENALSVGLSDSYENDDWSIEILGGVTIDAFGIILRDNKFEEGESLSFYHGSDLKDTILFSSLASSTNSDDFIGFTTDYMFDRVMFDEGSGGDDIAVADFRFAAVAPEPVSSTLFIIGGAALGMRRFMKKRKTFR